MSSPLSMIKQNLFVLFICNFTSFTGFVSLSDTFAFWQQNLLAIPSHEKGHLHTGKCIRRFGGIYAYCRYFIDRKW